MGIFIDKRTDGFLICTKCNKKVTAMVRNPKYPKIGQDSHLSGCCKAKMIDSLEVR